MPKEAAVAREDTFAHAREHLSGLSDAELEARFWELAGKCVDPLVELARTHTSPSIERGVLMRMGIDSPTAMAVVTECDTRGLLAHGAGHVVLKCMQAWGTDAPAAAERLAAGTGWDDVTAMWGGAR
jgi:D-ornithine 4,5-aminomutase subunit alpha